MWQSMLQFRLPLPLLCSKALTVVSSDDRAEASDSPRDGLMALILNTGLQHQNPRRSDFRVYIESIEMVQSCFVGARKEAATREVVIRGLIASSVLIQLKESKIFGLREAGLAR